MKPGGAAGRGGGGLLASTGGATYVEFLIAFIPIFIFFLGLVQAALAYTANLVVTHSANTAARAAIVVLPDDPAEYDGEAVNDLRAGSGGGGDSVVSFLEGVGLTGGASGPAASSGSSSRRMSAIRSAASIPLLAVSPSMDALVGNEEVYKAIGGNPANRAATGAALYNRMAVGVTFHDRPGSSTYKYRYGPNEDVTVRVTYLFHCAVPVANRWMCDDFVALNTGIPWFEIQEQTAAISSGHATANDIAELSRRVQHTRERLAHARGSLSDLHEGAQSSELGYLTVLTGARFLVMQAEATLRNQGAPYSYD